MSDPSSRQQRLVACLRLAVRYAVNAALALLGGWLAHLSGLPLAWLLGALAASALATICGYSVPTRRLRSYALVVLGLGLGQQFSADILASLATILPIVVACAVIAVASGLIGAGAFRRRAGLDPKTAFFCSVPGGVVLMAIHAERAGLSEEAVTLAQTVRLLFVVLTYPALISMFLPHEASGVFADSVTDGAGSGSPVMLALWLALGITAAYLGKWVRVPNPWMFAPALLAISFAGFDAVPADVPASFIVVGQVVLGMTLGAQMKPRFLFGAWPLLVASITSSLSNSAFLCLAAFGVWYLTDLPLGALLLGMAPGGMPEMAVTAHALGLSVPLVLGFHLVRVVISNFLIDPIWRVASRLRLA